MFARRALLLTIGGPAALVYLLRDEFTTAASAPLTSPRTCDPGPGTVTLTDSGNKLSVSGGELLMAAAVGIRDPLYLHSAGTSRVAGYLTQMRLKRTGGASNSLFLGVSPSTTPGSGNAYGFSISNSVSWGLTPTGGNAPAGAVADHADGTYNTFSIIWGSTGVLLFIDNVMLFDMFTGSEATLYEFVGALAANITANVDYFRTRPVTVSNLFAPTISQVNPTNNTNYAADADGSFFMTVTAPGSFGGSSAAHLQYRYQDSSNFWDAYFDNAGAFNLDSVIAGSRVNRISVASVIAAGQTRSIMVYAKSTKHDCWSWQTVLATKRGTQQDIGSTPMDAVGTVRPSFTDYTCSLLRCVAVSKSAWTTELAKT